MKKRKKGNHGVYNLTCISQKCGRRFKVMWEGKAIGVISRAYWDGEEKGYGLGPLEKRFKLVTYPFKGCPFCGAWWCTGPLDATAYPKRKLDPVFPVPADYTLVNAPLFAAGQQQANITRSVGLGAQGQANIAGGVLGGIQAPWWETRWTW